MKTQNAYYSTFSNADGKAYFAFGGGESYTFTVDETIDGEDDYSGNKLTGTAPHIFNAGIDYSNKTGIYAHLNYKFVDAMPMRDDNSIFSESFQVMNCKVGYQKTFLDKWNLNVFAGINNLWDEHYASMILINAGSFGGNAPRYYYPGLPRNYFGGVELKGWSSLLETG